MAIPILAPVIFLTTHKNQKPMLNSGPKKTNTDSLLTQLLFATLGGRRIII